MKDKHIKKTTDSQLLELLTAQMKRYVSTSKINVSRHVILKFLFYGVLATIVYSCLFMVNNLYVFLLCYVAYGFITLLFAFNFSHDLSHNTVFKSRKVNNLFYILSFTIVGAHAEAWKKRHINSHHYAPNVEGYDSDLKITKLIRVIPNSEFYWFHRFQYVYAPIAYMSYSLFWICIKDLVILFSKDNFRRKKNIKYYASFCLQKGIYIIITLLLPLLFSQQMWYAVVFGFLIMHMTLSLFLLFTFFMTHHVESTLYPTVNKDGLINTSWLMNQIGSSNDMHPFSHIANFIFGGFNNHVAHHLFPHIHHVHYPKLNKILYKVLIENGITPNQTSYFGGAISHLRLLKRMGKA
ncbi:fatty acid desaturase [uncultured Psychroserpens sp.]|uniref:fatty acid desaturase family protein n=1 Tax=uncultured Psychroserpens sp. TaxID=255436 RepID=UPI00261BF5BD|nr:fatty acid desaturase [uncultured Psychroserpens sp.]